MNPKKIRPNKNPIFVPSFGVFDLPIEINKIESENHARYGRSNFGKASAVKIAEIITELIRFSPSSF